MLDQYISHLSIINTHDVIQNYILRIASRIKLHRYPSFHSYSRLRMGGGGGEKRESSIILGHDTEFLNVFIHDEKPQVNNMRTLDSVSTATYLTKINLRISRKICLNMRETNPRIYSFVLPFPFFFSFLAQNHPIVS